MEICLVVLLFIPYLFLKYYFTDHETKAEKDAARFEEGIILYRNKRYEEAFAYFDQQVKLYPRTDSGENAICRTKIITQPCSIYRRR